MKYKDLTNVFSNASKLIQNKMLLRFFRCTPGIKKEIKQYLETEIFPNYKTIILVEGKEITLSVYSLVNNYNMTVLDAFLFIDEFLQPNANKQDLLNSLISLRVGEARPQIDLDHLRTNVDPLVKKQAELLALHLKQSEQKIEQEVVNIENNAF